MMTPEIKIRMVTCLTCSIGQAVGGVSAEDSCWNNSWNVNDPVEEEEAFYHAKDNPTHILIDAIDYGQEVNGG